MEIQNDDVTTLTHGEKAMPQVRPHVWEVPPDLGEHLLCFPHHGWRVPDLVEPEFHPPMVHIPVPVHIEPDPEPVVDLLAHPDAMEPLGDPADDGGTDVPPEPDPAPTRAPMAGDGASVTVADALVALALEAGPAGIMSAAAVAAHGRSAYSLLGTLVDDGRLLRVGRGRYVHPDHA